MLSSIWHTSKRGFKSKRSKYVPKRANFCTTNSLVTRVFIAARIQLVRNHFLWVQVMESLGLSVPIQTELYLLDLDKRKLRNFCREHNFSNIAKQKQKEHEKIRAELEQTKKGRWRNALYSSMTACDDTGKGSSGTGVKVAENLCTYNKYGCGGANKHKTNRCKHCIFFGRTDDEIIGEYFVWFITIIWLKYYCFF